MTKDSTPIELQQTELDEVNGGGDTTWGDLIITSVRDWGDKRQPMGHEKHGKFLDTMEEGETCGI